MEYLLIALRAIVVISILNVWLVQARKSTKWRGGNATTINEEFNVYGLPGWSVKVIGTIKVGLALMLLAGIWYPALTFPAAIGLATMLTGSVLMHFKIGDPIIKSFPAALFLTMCLVIAYFSSIGY
ncbi:MAG: DoxX family protein [Saprospiraceae bacterium]